MTSDSPASAGSGRPNSANVRRLFRRRLGNSQQPMRGPGLRIDWERLSAQRPPVLLFGGLSLLRPLGAAGIPVIIATPHPNTPALYSRYCSGVCMLPSIEDRAAVVRTLIEAGEQLERALGRPVPLFYGNDAFLRIIYAHREELSRHFLLLLNDPAIATALVQKDLFEALAKERGLLVPRTYDWDGDGEDGLRFAQGPVLIKPKLTTSTLQDSPLHVALFAGRGKAGLFENAQALLNLPEAARFKNDLVAQQYIAGDDRHLHSFHGFADERGELLAWFIGRKIRTFPALTGPSSYLELTHNEELRTLGFAAARQVPLKGAFKIDYKQDAGSGRFYLLEINARFNLWHDLGACNGINLPRVAYEYLVYGRRPEELHYGTKYRWLDLKFDYRAFRELAARGQLGTAEWLASVLSPRTMHNMFALHDPAPFFCHWGKRLLSKAVREVARLARRPSFGKPA